MKKMILFFMTINSLLLFSFDVELGNIRLSVNPSNGRYNIFYGEQGKRNEQISAFVSEDPRTTKTILIYGNNRIILGDEGGFSIKAEPMTGGALILWERRDLEVQQQIEILNPSLRHPQGALRTTFSITNKLSNSARLSLGLIFDTYLGEDGTHFYTSENQGIEGELRFRSPNIPEFLISSSSSLGVGFRFYTQGDEVSTPSLLQISNWRRLSDGKGNSNYQEGRNFNQLPYSIGDSALYFEYPITILEGGGKRTLSLLTVPWAPEEKRKEQDREEDKPSNPRVSDASSLTMDQLFEKDLDTLIQLVEDLNKKLTNPSLVTREDWALFESVLQEIESRKSRYQE